MPALAFAGIIAVAAVVMAIWPYVVAAVVLAGIGATARRRSRAPR